MQYLYAYLIRDLACFCSETMMVVNIPAPGTTTLYKINKILVDDGPILDSVYEKAHIISHCFARYILLLVFAIQCSFCTLSYKANQNQNPS